MCIELAQYTGPSLVCNDNNLSEVDETKATLSTHDHDVNLCQAVTLQIKGDNNLRPILKYMNDFVDDRD